MRCFSISYRFILSQICSEEARLANEGIEKGVSVSLIKLSTRDKLSCASLKIGYMSSFAEDRFSGAIAGVEYRLEEVGGHLQLGYEQIQAGVKLAESVIFVNSRL